MTETQPWMKDAATKAATKISESINEQLTAAGMTKLSGPEFVRECAADFAPIIAQEFAAHAPQQWIPVSERLPELNIDVLCACKDRTVHKDCRYGEGGWFDAAVTHWMPLPAPPVPAPVLA